MKNILILQGGGRANGNTAQLIGSFAKGAADAGHSVEIFSLVKNEVKGCLGCNACRYGKPCVQKDSWHELVTKIEAAGCIVFASPLYFWTLSARIKAVIERLYSIAEEDPQPPLGRYEKYPGKDCALLMTSADDFFLDIRAGGFLLSIYAGELHRISRQGNAAGRRLRRYEREASNC